MEQCPGHAVVLPEVHHYARLDRPPDILFMHVRGNDLRLRVTWQLILDIKLDFLCLRSFFSDTILAWSDIVGRSDWCLARSVDKLNNARIKGNKEVAIFFVRNGCPAVRLLELEGDNWIYLMGFT